MKRQIRKQCCRRRKIVTLRRRQNSHIGRKEEIVTIRKSNIEERRTYRQTLKWMQINEIEEKLLKERQMQEQRSKELKSKCKGSKKHAD